MPAAGSGTRCALARKRRLRFSLSMSSVEPQCWLSCSAPLGYRRCDDERRRVQHGHVARKDDARLDDARLEAARVERVDFQPEGLSPDADVNISEVAAD